MPITHAHRAHTASASGDGLELLVGEAMAMTAATSTSVYVKNLPPEETELSLYRIFAPLGAVRQQYT